jgi:hypothetical protein
MNQIRVGNFTSSEIFNLMKNGKEKGSMGAPAFTYIMEKNMERRLGRSVDTETDAKPLNWGKVLEKRAFDRLGTSYQLTSDRTYQHSTIKCWVGSPDGFHHNSESPIEQAVIDFKAPWTLKSFCQLVDAWKIGGIDAIRAEHKDGEKYFWQLVSNAAITGCSFAELIVYCPYQSELASIRQMVEGDPKAYFIWSSVDAELPFLPDDGYYKNINVMRFAVSPNDKLALHNRVELAAKELIEVPSLIPA